MNKARLSFSVDSDAAKILQCLYYHHVLGSVDISAFINRSIPHTIKLLNELLSAGYIIEKGYANSSGGRKPLQFALADHLFYTVSVAVNRFSVTIGVLNVNNEFVDEVFQHEIHLSQLNADQLASLINTYLDSTSITRNAILGIGVTMPGFIDPKKGINYTFLQVPGLSLMDYLQQEIGLPVFIENDSTAIAMGEQKFGAAMHQDDAMIINLGWGIGLGMIVNGVIFRGHTGLAGEFSHIPLVKNGKLCSCGKHGCLETEASLMAIIEKAYQELNHGQNSSLAKYNHIDADAIITEATKGDRLAVRLISEAAYHVGQCLAVLIHIMNPAVILLSGKASLVGRLWLAPIQQAINEHCIPRLACDTQIVVSDLNHTAQLIGGAVLVIENIGKPLEEKVSRLEKSLNIN